jgi:hypothetical protein
LCSEYLKQKAFFSPKILRKAPTHSQKQDPKKKQKTKKKKEKRKKKRKNKTVDTKKNAAKKTNKSREEVVFSLAIPCPSLVFFFSPDDQSWYFITDGTLNTKPLVGTTRILPFSQSQGLLQEPKQDKQKTKTQTKNKKEATARPPSFVFVV